MSLHAFRLGLTPVFNAILLDVRTRVELPTPHAYQAGSYEREFGSEVLTRLPFTNILLSMSRIYEYFAHFREHFAHANGHHNGHHRDPGASELVHFCGFALSSSNQFSTTISLSRALAARGRIIRRGRSSGATAYPAHRRIPGPGRAVRSGRARMSDWSSPRPPRGSPRRRGRYYLRETSTKNCPLSLVTTIAASSYSAAAT
jgi:hypothetical protein